MFSDDSFDLNDYCSHEGVKHATVIIACEFLDMQLVLQSLQVHATKLRRISLMKPFLVARPCGPHSCKQTCKGSEGERPKKAQGPPGTPKDLIKRKGFKRAIGWYTCKGKAFTFTLKIEDQKNDQHNTSKIVKK